MPGGERPEPEGAADFKASDASVIEGFIPRPLPPELMPKPHVPGGDRYGEAPTHWQNPSDRVGRVMFRTDPGVDQVDLSPGVEGVIVGGGYDFLLAKGAWDVADKDTKPEVKAAIEKAAGVTGVYYEQLGLGLTNIEHISVVAKDEDALREKLGSRFYNLVEQNTSVTYAFTREIITRSGKPLTPQMFEQLVSLALDIVGVSLEDQAGALSTETKTKIIKEVAARMWQAGVIDENDIKFERTYALTPDSKPRTAPKAK